MTTIELSMPTGDDFVSSRAVQCGFASVEDYLRHLIEQDRTRAEREQVDALLLEGMDSGEPLEFTDDLWRQKKAKLSRRASDSTL